MFYLISSDKPVHKYVILGGKAYIVGRRDCDVLVSDQTVSRKHAELCVSHSEANLGNVSKLPILKLKDLSKFGTWVNNQRVEGERILQDGDSVYFGSPKSTFKIVYEPLVVTSSCLDTTLKKSLKQGLCTLGGHMVPEWQKDCSLLVMSRISVTIKVICALVSQKHVVSPTYIDEYVKHLQGKGEKPDPSRYTPDLAETQLDGNDVSFSPDSRRKTIFQGKTFYFLSPKQLKKMNLAIELAGGQPILLEKGKMKKDILKPGSLVMNCTEEDNWVSEVQALLDRHNKHMISDAEIGYAVLYCSTEKHCNPDYIPDVMDISGLPSQSLSQVEPLVTDTQTQERTQRGVKTPKKGTVTRKDPTQATVDDTSRTQTPKGTQRGQIVESIKSPVLPVVKEKRQLPVSTSQQKSSKKRDRTEEDGDDDFIVSSKRVKSEKVTPSKSATLNSTKSKQKSTKSQPEDDEIVWGSDKDLDYSSIDLDVSVNETEKRPVRSTRQTSPVPNNKNRKGHTGTKKTRSRSPSPVSQSRSTRQKRSPAPKSRSPSPVPRSTRQKRSPAPKSRSPSPVPRSRLPAQRSRSPSPVPWSRSPAQRSRSPAPNSKTSTHKLDTPVKDIIIKEEPVTPNPKTSSRSKAKCQSNDSQGEMEVKAEQISSSTTERLSEATERQNLGTQLKREREEIYSEQSGDGVGTAGFLNARVAMDEQNDQKRHPEAIKEEDLPVGCINVETVSLVARRPSVARETGSDDCPDGFFRWKGKIVRNYKNFKKASHAGSQGLPRIIGGSDLEVHVAKRSKEIDDWFKESVQAETEHTAEEKRAQDLFDYDPSSRRRGR